MPDCDNLSATAEGWLLCPLCGRKRILRVLPGTVVRNLPVYCKQCRREAVINFEPEPEPEIIPASA